MLTRKLTYGVLNHSFIIIILIIHHDELALYLLFLLLSKGHSVR